MSFSFRLLIAPYASLNHVTCISAQQKSNQQQFKPTAAQPFLLVLTTIWTWRLGSGLSIAITTCHLSLASCVPSTSITTSGAIEVEFKTWTFCCPGIFTFLGCRAVDSDPGWLISLSYISVLSSCGISSMSACKGTAKSTKKSCHLLN